MGYTGQTYRIVLDSTGLQTSRNQDALLPTALIDTTKNMNFHEGGLGKRGGSSPFISAISGTPSILGLFQFINRTGTKNLVIAASDGKIYKNTGATTLKTGMSTSAFYNMEPCDDKLFITDGASVPQYWDGVAAATVNVTEPTDWATGKPFQFVAHARGANRRMWAIRADAVYASENGVTTNFADAQVKKIPVFSDSGLVGGVDFNGTLIVFSKTKTYIIDDTSSTVADWGYREAIWAGGVSSWRVITKAVNDVFLMTDDMAVYRLSAVNATGDYSSSNLTRPAYIDFYLSENVSRTNMSKAHSVYDRDLRKIHYFLPVGGSTVSTSLQFFVDRPSEVAWIVHNNTSFNSGYKAISSCSYVNSSGVYKVYAGTTGGLVWSLEDLAKGDNSEAYESSFKFKPLDFGNSRMYKHFRRLGMRIKTSTNTDVILRLTIDGSKKTDIPLAFTGVGAEFDSGIFDTDVFGGEDFLSIKSDFGYYGFTIQPEILNTVEGQDLFVSEIYIDFKPMGVR